MWLACMGMKPWAGSCFSTWCSISVRSTNWETSASSGWSRRHASTCCHPWTPMVMKWPSRRSQKTCYNMFCCNIIYYSVITESIFLCSTLLVKYPLTIQRGPCWPLTLLSSQGSELAGWALGRYSYQGIDMNHNFADLNKVMWDAVEFDFQNNDKSKLINHYIPIPEYYTSEDAFVSWHLEFTRIHQITK